MAVTVVSIIIWQNCCFSLSSILVRKNTRPPVRTRDCRNRVGRWCSDTLHWYLNLRLALVFGVLYFICLCFYSIIYWILRNVPEKLESRWCYFKVVKVLFFYAKISIRKQQAVLICLIARPNVEIDGMVTTLEQRRWFFSYRLVFFFPFSFGKIP